MNWAPIIIATGIALLIGAWANVRLARRRPGWSSRRRILTAAAIAPLLVFIATVVSLAWLIVRGPGDGENMQDLALFVTMILGAFFAFATFCGGLVGAVWVDKKPEQ